MEYAYHEVNKEKLDREKLLRSQLNGVQKKVDVIEEKYFVTTEMTKATLISFTAGTNKKSLLLRIKIAGVKKTIATVLS